ncbi:MAG: DUF4384 domain-containing protein [Proteobacteria bacterium]|nr:DUF4384 domain-containing protein [Pseudomonadota bacterium]
MMNKEWICQKCGRTNDPKRDDYSLTSCYHCQKSRFNWLIWAGCASLIVFFIIVVGIFFIGRGPEDEFIKQVKVYIKSENIEDEGILSDKESEYLDRMAIRYDIVDKKGDLIERAKNEYLDENRKRPQDELCTIAKNMNKSETMPGCPEFLNRVLDYLENGHFDMVQKLISKIPPSNSEGQKLRNELNTPLKVGIEYQYLRNSQEPSEPLPINSPELQNIVLTSKDKYRLKVSSSHKNSKVYIYIFQHDHSGKISKLFPKDFGSELINPLRYNSVYNIPEQEGNWLSLEGKPLDKLGLNVKTLYVIASPWQAEDIDEYYRMVERSDSADEIITDLIQAVKKRKNTGISSIYYFEYKLNHSIHVIKGKEWWHIGFGEYGYTYQDVQEILKNNKDRWALPSIEDMKSIDKRESSQKIEVYDISQDTPYWTSDISNSGKPYGYCFGTVGNCEELYPYSTKDFHEADALSIILVRQID